MYICIYSSMTLMITVEQAEEIVLSNTIKPNTEKVTLESALSRILAEDLLADRDFPPFDRVTMDGIAIAYEQIKGGRISFRIEQRVPAGKPQVRLENAENCAEVMTGAMLPIGTDTVIRYEDLDIIDNIATVNEPQIQIWQNVHKQGIDRREGEVIVPKGRVITPAEIGVAATIGKHQLMVQKNLRAMVIATGEEIVQVNETPLPYQIRTSNSYALQAGLISWGVETSTVLLPDDQQIIEQRIKEYLEEYDVLVLSGGVSAGKYDFVPAALENQGVRKLFHKVSQRPGKPFWFGVKNRKAVFALPGNPVSTFMCLHRYVRPWLNACAGIPSDSLTAELTSDFSVNVELTFFLLVTLEISPDGGYKATPVKGNGSGDLASLADADAFMELPLGKEIFSKGERYRIWPYR